MVFRLFPHLKGLENKTFVMSPKSKLKACQGSFSEGGSWAGLWENKGFEELTGKSPLVLREKSQIAGGTYLTVLEQVNLTF